MKRLALLAIALMTIAVVMAGCTAEQPKKDEKAELQQEVQTWLDAYTKQYLPLYYAAAEADWASNTHIVEGDETNANATKAAKEALAAFTGSEENINTARGYLEKKADLTPIQVKQLETVLYYAADNPATVPEIVKERIAAETAQTEKLYGFAFKLDGKEITPNQIDTMLADEKNVKKREKVWDASKEVGKVLRDGLVSLQKLRNETVRALGYADYFTYQVSDYGMTTDEMMTLNRQLVKDIWPLYRELHTWARYTLAKKYGQKVPDMLPAHWLPNRWGQDWTALVNVEGFNLDSALKDKTPEWLVKQAESFYVSLGFPVLPPGFYEKSSLYPVAADAGFKKNTHASAWHMDLQNDIRSLMSVENNTEWYETVHHELGHIYYYISYTNPDVPPLLRSGANRAYHEAVGSLMGLASMQPSFVKAIGLMPADAKMPDPIQTQLKESLNYIVFIPFSAGTMTEFEHDLYTNELPSSEWNKRWWELVTKYQGIVPPTARGEEYCDAATKTHINDDAAQYYDYALSYALLFQLHLHIAKDILNEDPHNTNYYGRTDVGDFLRKILTPGASADWRQMMKETVGEDLNAKALMEYFAPLYDWLKEQNKGRTYTLPETFQE